MYLTGFGNYHQTEAVSGALPKNQNSPQNCAFNLYTEQLSGSAFTRPRALNLHSCLYRILPSVVCGEYKLYFDNPLMVFSPLQSPNPHRWSPLTLRLNKATDFVDGLFPIAGNHVANVFSYGCNHSMRQRFFSNNDGELLFIPYIGDIVLYTEFGRVMVSPGKIAVIPRGVKFKVVLDSELARGYLCENLALPFTLPELGPIGANGLANPRHFLYPAAYHEPDDQEVELICKYQHHLWTARSLHSPLNVVAWQGNYAPYSYDLSLFNSINTVSFDHSDPSIFTVLTAASDTPGMANLDFVIFPPRWLVTEHTFRPPYFHKNIMSELMGLIKGEYDAKKSGFLPGGVSLHNCMVAHGPDTASYLQAINSELKPEKYENTLAFMLESSIPWSITTK